MPLERVECTDIHGLKVAHANATPHDPDNDREEQEAGRRPEASELQHAKHGKLVDRNADHDRCERKARGESTQSQ